MQKGHTMDPEAIMSPGPGSDLLPARAVFVLPASARPSMNPHKVQLGWSFTPGDDRLSGFMWKDPDQQERRQVTSWTWIIFGPTLSANTAGWPQLNQTQVPLTNSSRKRAFVSEETGKVKNLPRAMIIRAAGTPKASA